MAVLASPHRTLFHHDLATTPCPDDRLALYELAGTRMARGCPLVSKAPRSIDRAQSHTTERTFLPGQAEGKYRSIWSRITVEGDFTNTSRSPCYHLSRSGDCSRIAVPPCHLPFAPTVVIGPICPDSVNCESVGLTLSTPNTLKPAVPVLSLAAGLAL